MKERRFKICCINFYKSYGSFALPLYFDHYPPCFKNKFEQHWRLEFGERLEIYFLWWNITIHFNNSYWEEVCKKRNSEMN